MGVEYGDQVDTGGGAGTAIDAVLAQDERKRRHQCLLTS